MQESIRNASQKLRLNKYPERWIKTDGIPNQHPKKQRSKKKEKQRYAGILRLPFINNSFNAVARRILNRNGLDTIRITNSRPITIQQLASKKEPQATCTLRKCPIQPPQTACTKSHVVYEVTCLICMATYLGSTTRALHTRAREHLYNIKRKKADKSALAEHYINQHHTATESPKIKFKVLCSTRDGLRLRIEETYWIRRLQPAINRKKEGMGTGFLA